MPRKRTTYQKEFILIPSPHTGMVRIGFEGGGEVPRELHGVFTKKQYALDAIERYKFIKGID